MVNFGAELEVAEASFVDENTLKLSYADGDSKLVKGERFFINTGSTTVIPPILGIEGNEHVYTSETLMSEERLLKRLVVIGGGYIGLEFASYYRNFGSEVTILHRGHDFMGREDKEIAQAVLANFGRREINIIFDAEVESMNGGAVSYFVGEEKRTIEGDAVLIAVGRKANTAGLGLDNAGVKLNQRGEVIVDEKLRSSNEHIFAMGDVKGGLQFTYISQDDFRILVQDGRTTQNRGAIPYSVFIDPPVSRVGMTEEEAKAQGLQVMVRSIPASSIPKTLIFDRREGMMKAVVEKGSGRILGAHLFAARSEELINIVKLAMDAGLGYQVLKNQIFTHPSMAESLNSLFGF